MIRSNVRPGIPARLVASAVGRVSQAVVLVLILFLIADAAVSASVSALPACPFPAIVQVTPTTGIAPEEVRLNATVSSGSPTTYDWSFGDGSYWNGSGNGASDPLHRYGTPGSYSVQVSVVEATCVAVGETTFVAAPGPLDVVATATPSSGTSPLTIGFSATITGGSGTYVSVFWSFGDGGVGSGDPVNYTYSHTGTYTASVNVTDSSGHWAVAEVPLTLRGTSVGAPSSLSGPASIALAAGTGAIVALAAVGLAFRLRTKDAEQAGPSAPGRDSSEAAAGWAPQLSRTTNSESPGVGTSPPTISAATPTERASRPSGHGPALERLKLTQRVILHIGAQGRLAPDDVGKLELTQAGISSSLGISQNSVTNVLRRLVAAELLEQDLRHVSGQPRRLRVYRFTARGESVYRDIWLRTRDLSPPASDEAGARSPGSK